MLKGYHGLLCVHYLCPKSGEGRKVRSVFAKMRAIRKKQLRPQFPKCCFHIESAFSQVGHCGYHRHQTKLYVGSALVLAMYGRSTELGLFIPVGKLTSARRAGAPTVCRRWVCHRTVGESNSPITTAAVPPTMQCTLVGVQHPPKSAYPKSCHLFLVFFVFFLDKIDFLDQTVNFCLYHVLHILKASALTVHLGYKETFLSILRGVVFLLTQCTSGAYVNSILPCYSRCSISRKV